MIGAPFATRWLLGSLLVVAAAVFTLGALLERGDHHHGAPAGEEQTVVHDDHDETPEAIAGRTDDERVLGIDVESAWFLALGVGVSVALAAAVIRSNATGLLLAVLAFAVVATVLDVGEVVHQLDREERLGLFALALVAGVLHLAAVADSARRCATGGVTNPLRTPSP